MKKKEISRYYLLALIFLIILLAFLIIRPFIKDVLIAIIISYVFYPIYKRINTRLNSTLSALVVCLLVILLVTLPLIFVLNAVYDESFRIYSEYLQGKSPLDEITKNCIRYKGHLCNFITGVKNLMSNPLFKGLYESSIKTIPNHILNVISGRVLGIPRILLNIFIVLFTTYYLLKDGKKIYNKVVNILPIKKPHQDILFKSFGNVTYAVVYGHIIVALVQGIIGTIGFVLFKIPSPILLGSIMTIFALIPYLGAGVVWLPASLLVILNGLLQQDNSVIIRGILLLLYGILIISTIDNILRPKVIGTRADIHPLIVLIGVLGGLTLLGIVGIVIGPVILAACIVMIELYLTQNKSQDET